MMANMPQAHGPAQTVRVISGGIFKKTVNSVAATKITMRFVGQEPGLTSLRPALNCPADDRLGGKI